MIFAAHPSVRFGGCPTSGLFGDVSIPGAVGQDATCGMDSCADRRVGPFVSVQPIGGSAGVGLERVPYDFLISAIPCTVVSRPNPKLDR